MSLQPKRVARPTLGYLSDSGIDGAKLQLLMAVYRDDTQQALTIIETDPDQIMQHDPFAGLTPLHIAIVRENEEVAIRLARHPLSELTAQDHFGRRAVDMLDYTSSGAIIDAITEASFPFELRSLAEPAFDDGAETGNIIPLRPPRPDGDDTS